MAASPSFFLYFHFYPLISKNLFWTRSGPNGIPKNFHETSHHLLYHAVPLDFVFPLFGQNLKITLRPETYAKLHLFGKHFYLPLGSSGAIIMQGFTFIRVLLTILGLPYGGSIF